MLKDPTKKPVSIIPEKPEAQGLIHFYKKDDAWHFVAEDEYEAKKDSLPQVCFATRSPIDNFSGKSWPDLNRLVRNLSPEAEGEPTYYAKYTFGTQNASDCE